MKNEDNLTFAVKTLCHSLVREHIPQQEEWFNPIWEAVWHSLPAKTIEDLRDIPNWHSDKTGYVALSALGDMGQQAIDTLHIVGAVIGAVITLLNQDRSVFIDTAQIDTAIRNEATRLKTPEHVRRILETFATGMLAEQLSAIDWEGYGSTTNRSPTGSLWVEWCDPVANSSDRLSVLSDVKTRNEVEKDLSKRAESFVLYIDEPESLIISQGVSVNWDDLDARYLRFLYLVLSALPHRDIVHHSKIASQALQIDVVNEGAIRRLKSELNTKLHGAINQFVQAQKRMHRYKVKLIPYCWIRYDGASSRLYSEAPV